MSDKMISYQVNGGPWQEVSTTKPWDLPFSDLLILGLVEQGVTFGALDHYEDDGEQVLYRNIKFRVEEGS
jgi:hypothetical protein